MSNGYVYLHRQIEDSSFFKDSEAVHLWIYLLIKASYKSKTILFNGRDIELKPGQFITGRKSIQEATGIEQSKCERLLRYFESAHQIEQQKTNKYRIISIVNWDMYQGSEQQNEQQVNNKRTTDEQQMNTNNKEKKEKKEKKYNKEPIPEKLKFLETVFLTSDQHQKLISKYGKTLTEKAIEILNNAIMSKGYKYKSHYHTLIGWPMDRAKEQGGNGNGNQQGRVFNGTRGNRVQPEISTPKEYRGDDLPEITEEQRKANLARIASITGWIGKD